MPKLIIFAPCEKLIFAEESKAASIINLLWGSNIKIGTPETSGDVTIPLNWSVFCFWQRDDIDVGKTFEQRIQLVLPSGRVFIDATQTFAMERLFHRTVVAVTGFPVMETGHHTIRVLLRELPSDSEPAEINSCYLVVTHSADGERPQAVT